MPLEADPVALDRSPVPLDPLPMHVALPPIAIGWIGLPEPTAFQSQMMLLGGFSLLAWILVRRTIRTRRQGRRDEIEWKQQEKRATARDASTVPLGDAPVEVLRWQSAMFDLQRELKAELETKISVVQAMIRLADQRIATLESLSPTGLGDRPADDSAPRPQPPGDRFMPPARTPPSP